MSAPCVNVFWNENETHYVVQYQVAAPDGGSEAFGDPILVSTVKLASEVGKIVLEGLAKYFRPQVRPQSY